MKTLKKAVKALILCFAACMVLISEINADAAKDNDTTVTVDVDLLHVREKPGFSGKLIGYVNTGNTLRYVGTIDEDWIAVEFFGKVGYVASEYVTVNHYVPLSSTANETSTKEISAKETTSKQTASKQTSTKETSTKEASAKKAPVKEAPAEVTPVQEASKEVPSTQDSSLVEELVLKENTSVKAVQEEQAPSEEILPEEEKVEAEETPAEEVAQTEETSEETLPAAEESVVEEEVQAEELTVEELPAQTPPSPETATAEGLTIDGAVTTGEVPVPEKQEDSYEVLLLGALIQCEAVGECYQGQVAVGDVVMNRVADPRFPSTVEGVIYQSGQFTPVGSGKVDRVLNSNNINESCLQAAREALAGASVVGDCVSFRRAGKVNGMVIGNHVFF